MLAKEAGLSTKKVDAAGGASGDGPAFGAQYGSGCVGLSK